MWRHGLYVHIVEDDECRHVLFVSVLFVVLT